MNFSFYLHCYKDCRFSISEETAIFATFQVDSLKVSEADTTVHVKVYRYGRMLSPVTVRVADEPGTASNSMFHFMCYASEQYICVCVCTSPYTLSVE